MNDNFFRNRYLSPDHPHDSFRVEQQRIRGRNFNHGHEFDSLKVDRRGVWSTIVDMREYESVRAADEYEENAAVGQWIKQKWPWLYRFVLRRLTG